MKTKTSNVDPHCHNPDPAFMQMRISDSELKIKDFQITLTKVIINNNLIYKTSHFNYLKKNNVFILVS